MVDNYRYGFNGAEKDDEISGNGNTYDLGLRHYDARLGRMFSRDPREVEYPWQSTYAYYANSPISTIDFMGGGADDWVKQEGSDTWEWDEEVKSEKEAKTKYGENTEYGRIGHIYHDGASNKYIELGDKGVASEVVAKDHMEEKILSGEYGYTKNYGWVDYGHAFYGDDPRKFLDDVFWEPEAGEYNPGMRYISYSQSVSRYGYTIEYGYQMRLDMNQSFEVKMNNALWLFETVSKGFEQRQLSFGNAIHYKRLSNSGWEPADLTSNLLGFYKAVGYEESYLRQVIGEIRVETSLEIYRMYPGLYSEEKYKNYNMFQPIYFPNPYTGTPVYPDLFKQYSPIKPAYE